MKAAEFLGGEEVAPGEWRFAMGQDLLGAFGGVFGGALAAASVMVARSVEPGRVPAALDCQFLRGLPAGTPRLHAEVLHSGRRLLVVRVEVSGEDGRLATVATVSMVSRETLHPLDRQGAGASLPPWGSGQSWRNPGGVEAPIVATLAPRSVPAGPRTVATAIRVPWSDAAAGAEGACLAADLCVGPPVAGACGDRWVRHPNPDLSLRFAGQEAEPELVAVGRLERVDAGVATVGIQVHTRSGLVALGISSSLLLSPRD